MSAPAIPLVGDVMRHTVSPLLGCAFARQLIAKIFAPCPVPHRFTAQFPVGLALRPSQIRATAAETGLMVPATATLSPRYRELRVPLSIMAGADDQIVDASFHSTRLHEMVPGSAYRLIKGGHMIHHLAPKAVSDLIEGVRSRIVATAIPSVVTQ
jgi:pimeloyl-ACP methyl ester carboxylesterase